MTTRDRFDADRLDDWLEGMSGSGRPTISPNGEVGIHSDLLEVAQEFHTTIRSAESRLPVPVTRIWEDIMATTSTLNVPTASPPTSNAGVLPPSGGSFGHPDGDHGRRGFMYWAVPIGMVALVVFAIVAVTYLANRSDDELAGITYYPETPGLAANIAASPESENIAQIPAPVECTATPLTLEQIAAVQENPAQLPERMYGPVVPADPTSALQIAQSSAQFDACSFIGEWRSVASERLIANTQVAGSPGGMILTYYQSELGMTSAEIVDIVRTLSTEATTGSWQDYLLVVDEMDPAQVGQPFVNPDHVMELPDGRLGVAQSFGVLSSELEGVESQNQLVIRPFQIFVQEPADSGQWVMDELLQVCIGDCEDYFTNLQMSLDANAAILTPIAPTPVSSPEVDLGFVPVTAEECDVVGLSVDEVSAIVRDPGEEPERSYIPVGPADPDAAAAAVSADRAWQSCGIYGSIGQRTVLQSPWLTSVGPELQAGGYPPELEVAEQRLAERQALTDAILGDTYADQIGLLAMSDEEVQLGFTPVSQVPNLQSATLLQDGRVAIAMVLLTPEPYFSSALKSPPAYWLVEAHILSKDPETGAWVMDEVFHVCGGDCEQYLELIGEREAYLLDPSGFEPATAEATPAN